MADPERGQVVDDGSRVVEGEVGGDLQPVGGGRDVPPAVGLAPAAACRTTVARAATVRVSPALTTTGSTSDSSAVSITTVQPSAYSAGGAVNSIGSWWALNAR